MKVGYVDFELREFRSCLKSFVDSQTIALSVLKSNFIYIGGIFIPLFEYKMMVS